MAIIASNTIPFEFFVIMSHLLSKASLMRTIGPDLKRIQGISMVLTTTVP
jgi:hypothetical protein